MANQLNRVEIQGNLTRDPELRSTGSGTSVANLRIANNRRFKNGTSGEWEERPGFFDVTVWGRQAENCCTYLARGRQVLIAGELRWREWQDQQGNKRQSVEINADEVIFLQDGGGEQRQPVAQATGMSGGDLSPLPEGDFGPSPSSAIDDDIPF